MATLASIFNPEAFSSTSATISSRLTVVLEQVGQDTISKPSRRKFKAFRIAFPALISSTGSPVIETLIVSPIPSFSKDPIPIDDFTRAW